MKTKFLIPLVIFVVLVGFLAIGLNRDPSEVPSPLINKAAPAFEIPQLEQSNKTTAQAPKTNQPPSIEKSR
jgi:cytochrome c biogenesis protein CcmG/thiol:disulfide interchange protein DsbE